MIRFVVLGAGAIGGVVGAFLVKNGHEVVFIARGEHGAIMAREGLRLGSPSGVEILNVDVVPSTDQHEFAERDVLLLAVKSQDTVAALDQIAATAKAGLPVVCLQNGVNNEREALRRFQHVYGATVLCPSVHLNPGEVLAHSAPTAGVIDVGRYPQGVDANVDAIVTALAGSTFSSQAQPEIARWKWAKLLSNLGNAIEAVCGPRARNGRIGDLVRAEAEAVLRRAGIGFISDAEVRQRRGNHLQLQPVAGNPRPGGSTWQSVARKKGTAETDYLNGEIVMLGRIHRVPTPVNEALQDHVHRAITTGAEPGSVDEDDFLEVRDLAR